MTTVPPPAPIPTDLTPEWIAAIIDHAADLIETDGLEVGSFWADALFGPYEPGSSCDAAGALAVVCGFRRPADVEDGFIGLGSYDPETGITAPDTPHPAFEAAMAALGFREAEDLHNWSDTAGDHAVVERLREAATKIRARGAVA
jgi:hypothetical protein